MNMIEKSIKLNDIKLKIEKLNKEYNIVLNTPCEKCCNCCKFLMSYKRCELNQKVIPSYIYDKGCECYEESDDYIPF